MSDLVFYTLVLAAILMQLIIGIIPIKSISKRIQISRVISLFGIAVSLVAGLFVFFNGMTESGFIGVEKLGFSLRMDAFSVIMFGMISIISFVVLRYSYNYLDGDAKQSAFIGRLLFTVACIQLMVLSGNIFMFFVTWVAINLSFHKLLLYYPELKKARIAARKKAIISRLGEVTFLGAVYFIYQEFGTGNLEEIFQQLQVFGIANFSYQLESAAILLVVTAALSSAQFPFHAWLIEVMEAPTPVSALLHAGLLNAGPFLMIRFAYVLDASQVAPILLFSVGLLTALFGAIVFITQSSVKTSLAYSSVAHMGFTLMVSGLGVYSASLLHLVAHSFYKAHSFLSSGSLVDKVHTKQVSVFVRKGSPVRISIGALSAISLYFLIAYAWGVNFQQEYKLLILGGIILIGIIGLFINAFDSLNTPATLLKITGGAIAIILLFFGLEELFHFTIGSEIPALTEPSTALKYLSVVALIAFLGVVLFQAIAPSMKTNTSFKNLGVHLRNGLYINVLFDRLLNSFSTPAYSKTKLVNPRK